MRLFPKPDGSTDRFDRAGYITFPFDIGANVYASWEVPLSVSFAHNWTTPGSVGFVPIVCSAPVNPLAAHIGNGAMLVTWDAPLTGQASAYEIWGSSLLAGNYYKFSNGEFNLTHGVLNNLPVQTEVYLKIRAKSPTGNYGPFAQFRPGSVNYPTVKMKVRSVSGSIISAGSVFTKQISGSRLLALKALSEITIP